MKGKKILAMILSVIGIACIIEIHNIIEQAIISDKGIVYLQNSEVSEYQKGYTAGYNQAIIDMSDQKFLDGDE